MMENSLTIETHARNAWGISCPDWVLTLAKKCDKLGLQETAKLVAVPDITLSRIIKNQFYGNSSKIQETIEGLFSDLVVECPVLGDIPYSKCIKQQRSEFSSANSVKIQLYKACRTGCPHSKLEV